MKKLVMNTNNKCMRCNKDSHYLIQIYMDNGFPISFCDKHKNFKPNKFIVYIDSKYHLHYKFPKHYMRVYKISYNEAKLKYYRLKHWQKETLNF